MVRPAVTVFVDPSAALVAFSKSFKKVRRAGTAKAIRRQKTRDEIKSRLRAVSLPDLKNLLAVVRDNAQTPNHPPQTSSHGPPRQNRSCSLFTSALELPSSSLVLSNEYFAKNFLADYLHETRIEHFWNSLNRPTTSGIDSVYLDVGRTPRPRRDMLAPEAHNNATGSVSFFFIQIS